MITQFILYTILAVSNLAFLLTIICSNAQRIYKIFLFLTIICFTLSTIYFLLVWIYQTRLFFRRNDKITIEKIQNSSIFVFIRERYFKFAFTAEVTICIAYWGLVLGGEKIMRFDDSAYSLIMAIYLHFIIGLEVLLELILRERKVPNEHYIRDYIIMVIGVIAYSVILVTVAKITNFNVYAFLELEYLQITIIFVILHLLFFNVYQFYHYYLNKVNSKKSNSLNSIITENKDDSKDISLLA